jgi:hypothetical protein
MQFTTQIPIPKSNHPIDYNSKIVSLGSCFAENIGEKFDYFKFQNTVNPFGIIFNPVSIENIISRAVNQNYFTEKDVFFHNDLWHCYEVHSELSYQDKAVLLGNLNQAIAQMHDLITTATHVIITYGTSWVYKLKATQQVVANCHKVPQNQFDKVLLSVSENEQALANTLTLIAQFNPHCSVIFTVSPVRHIKDGFVENQRSKAHLLSAIHEMVNGQSTNVTYFPSYEIMMDELRDYRFYADDMLHPSVMAVDYIWERFFLTQIAQAVYPVMEEVETIQKGLAHRPFHPDTDSHRKFLEVLTKKAAALQAKYPHMRL